MWEAVAVEQEKSQISLDSECKIRHCIALAFVSCCWEVEGNRIRDWMVLSWLENSRQTVTHQGKRTEE